MKATSDVVRSSLRPFIASLCVPGQLAALIRLIGLEYIHQSRCRASRSVGLRGAAKAGLSPCRLVDARREPRDTPAADPNRGGAAPSGPSGRRVVAIPIARYPASRSWKLSLARCPVSAKASLDPRVASHLLFATCASVGYLARRSLQSAHRETDRPLRRQARPDIKAGRTRTIARVAD